MWTYDTPDTVKNNYSEFMKRLETGAALDDSFLGLIRRQAPEFYQVMLKAIQNGLIERLTIEGDLYLNFTCKAKTSVPCFFREGGFTEWKYIHSFVRWQKEPLASPSSLKSQGIDAPPEEFESIKAKYFQ